MWDLNLMSLISIIRTLPVKLANTHKCARVLMNFICQYDYLALFQKQLGLSICNETMMDGQLPIFLKFECESTTGSSDPRI